jgi:hypothetical protein
VLVGGVLLPGEMLVLVVPGWGRDRGWLADGGRAEQMIHLNRGSELYAHCTLKESTCVRASASRRSRSWRSVSMDDDDS